MIFQDQFRVSRAGIAYNLGGLFDFAFASKMMNMEQFLAGAREQGVLAHDEIEAWQQKMKVADSEGRFAFAGMRLAGGEKGS